VIHDIIEVPDDYTDPECQAIAEIAALMATLDPAAQDRIAAWVFDRYRRIDEPRDET
jgi:hypothetical protein